MTRFNPKTNDSKVKNFENEVAYSMSNELELYAAVVTSSFSDSFYESNSERLERISKLVTRADKEFVAKLAVYAREQMNLRTIPLVLVTLLAKVHHGDDLVSKTVKRIVKRTDEITELLACYSKSNDRTSIKKLNKLSKQIQKGLSSVFNNFDEYQFAKYSRDGDVSLRDALFLTHPVAKDENQQKLFDKIATNSLETPYTWETELSSKGNTKEVWTELIDSKRLPYMAMLRNLRNMINAKVDFKHLYEVTKVISDPARVKTSKQFPFRFFSAYKELREVISPETSLVLSSLEDAAKETAKNIESFDENTTVAIACDVSGSMEKPISAKSKVELYDVGLILAMLLQSRCKQVVTSIFGNTNKIIPLPNDNILRNAIELHEREGEVGYSTNGHKVIESLIEKNISVDKIMIFTDCQMWDSMSTGSSMKKSWLRYKKIQPAAKLYLFDLSGYGNSPVKVEDNDSVFLIAGWSDRVFDIMKAYDRKSSAVDEINRIVL